MFAGGLISRPQLSAHAILTAHEGTALIGRRVFPIYLFGLLACA